MTYVNDLDLNALTTKIDHLLEAEKAARVDCIEEYLIMANRRQEISELYQKLSFQIQMISNRISRLPRVADKKHVQWACTVLTMKPLFLVLDTTGLSTDSDIIRVFIRDENGVVFDSLINPLRQPLSANSRFTGIRQNDLENAPTLSESWDKIQLILRGRYILAYNLQFVKDRFEENAKYYGLPEICLIGRCLQRFASEYFDSYSMKLTQACLQVGYRLPEYPTAPERALGQLHLLGAMMQGITTAPVPSSEPEAIEAPLDALELDDHPF